MKRGIIQFTVLVLMGTLLLAACAGPTPPPTPTPLPSTAPATATPLTLKPKEAQFYPPSRPSAVRGRELYAADCATCHGDVDRGPDLAARFMNPRPTDFTNREQARKGTPEWYYRAITKGVLGSAMLPFDGVLDEEQRWDVLFYAWSLATTPQRIAAGQEVYAAHCAACHGQSGRGDGPAAAGLDPRPADFTDARFMAARSSQQLFGAITNGVADTAMPAWKDALSEEERWDVVDYIWTFMYEYR